MPDLGGVVTWIQDQASYVLFGAMAIFTVKFAIEQDWAKAVIFLLCCGGALFTIKNPEAIANAIASVFELII